MPGLYMHSDKQFGELLMSCTNSGRKLRDAGFTIEAQEPECVTVEDDRGLPYRIRRLELHVGGLHGVAEYDAALINTMAAEDCEVFVKAFADELL